MIQDRDKIEITWKLLRELIHKGINNNMRTPSDNYNWTDSIMTTIEDAKIYGYDVIVAKHKQSEPIVFGPNSESNKQHITNNKSW